MEHRKTFTFAGRTFGLTYVRRDWRQLALGFVFYNYRKNVSLELELGPISLELITPQRRKFR
jgi:hypothetical protein